MNNTLKNAILGSALLLSMGAANAAMVDINAGNYTFSYDNAIWGESLGSTFTQIGNQFTFSDLGALASITSRSGYQQYSYEDYLSSAITVSAHAGYQINSIQNNAAGSVYVATGIMTATTVGSQYAFAGVENHTYWTGLNDFDVGTLNHYTNMVLTSEPSTTSAQNYSDYVTTHFSPNTLQSTASISTLSTLQVYGRATASASLDSLSFNVAVTPVPEAETYGMLLMGLGFMGFITRRRRNDAA